MAIIRFLLYFIYITFIIFLLVKGASIQRALQLEAGHTYNPYPHLIFLTLFPIVIGLLLSLPQLIGKIRKPGMWCFDWIRFLAVGIPALFITVAPLIGFSPAGELVPPWLLSKIISYTMSSSMIPLFASGIIFGYVVLSSLEKRAPY